MADPQPPVPMIRGDGLVVEPRGIGASPAQPAEGQLAAWHAAASQAAPPAASASTSPSPQAMLQAFRRRWVLAVTLGLVTGSITGAAAWLLLPSARYTAESILQIYSRAPVVVFSTADNTGQANDEFRRYQKTQTALVKSGKVLLPALRTLNAHQLRLFRTIEDPLQWLKDNLDVAFTNDSEIFRIALTGDYPDELAKIVNQVTETYIEEVVLFERNRRTERYDKLRELNLKKLNVLSRQRQQVRDLAETLGSDNQQALVLKQQFDIENLAWIEKELIQVQSDKRKLESTLAARLKLVETSSEAGAAAEDASAIEEALENEPSVVSLGQQLAAVERQLSQHTALLAKTARRPAADPMLAQLQSELRRVRSELSQRKRALRPMVARDVRTHKPEAGRDSIAGLRHQLAVLKEIEDRLLAEKSNQALSARTNNVKTLDLQSAQEQIAQSEIATQKMGAEIQALEVELEAPGRVNVIEKASVPRVSDAKKRYMKIGVAALGVFLLSVLGITFWELQTRKVTAAAEITASLGLRVMGTLPAMPIQVVRGERDSERYRERVAHLEQMMCESIDLTRTLLLSSIGARRGQVVAITSSVGGEGKTSLACHLATSLARSGRKTVLIDADLRKPMVSAVFETPLSPGLSEVLRGQTSLEDALVSTSAVGLDLLTAGVANAESMRVLSLAGISTVLDQLKRRYDCVIIDTAPVLPITDTLLIAPHTDGVILSVLSEISRANLIAETRQRLLSVGVQILGVVFAGDRGSPGGDYRYRYGRQVAPASSEGTDDDSEAALSDPGSDAQPIS